MELPDDSDLLVVDFPSLLVVPEWIEHHCTVPDGDRKGDPFGLYDWQLHCTVHHYRVRPGAKPGQNAAAFHFRRSQVMAPQKTGKGPWSAALIAGEALGPVRFAGWAEGGELFDCREHRCSCGFVYEYSPGEPMGRPWATPLIQLLATAEDQTDNVYRPLQAMARSGPLAERMKVGEEFIRLPNEGRIDVVTSSAQARLGNPITFALQDETGLYTVQNKMIRVAETMRRGLAGMGGRSIETTNPHDPSVDSTAKRTYETKSRDVFRFHRPPPPGLDYGKKADRRKIHRINYAGSPHVDPIDIDREADELAERDPAQAERFFGNRITAGAGAAFDPDQWSKLANPALIVPGKSIVTIGVDGARFFDALAIIATDVNGGHQWPLAIIERPENAPDDYEHDFEAADQALRAAFDQWTVWRVYIDPQYIDTLVDRWQGRWGKQRVVPWFTGRLRPMAFALQSYRQAMSAGDLSHDGDTVFAQHITNATKDPVNVLDDEGHPMWHLKKPEPGRKIDASMAGALSWEARGDCIAAGANVQKTRTLVAFR